MQGGLFQYILLAGLACALAFAAFTDIRHRHIGNGLNAAIALAAPLFWWASGLALWPDIAAQFALAISVFAVLCVLFALRMMGGGDVKLLTALALWIQPALFLKLIVIMALAGGALTLLMAGWHTIRRRKERLSIPYGVAIALAGIWVVGAHYWPAVPTSGGLAG